MAIDMFLKCKGLEGEAQDKEHKDEIDVLDWSWGASNSGTSHVGGGGGAGKVNVQDLSVTKWVDKSSTALMLACCNGKHFPEMTLTVRKAGETALEYIVIIIKECLITSLSTGGSGGEDRLTENVSINFATVEVKYTPQKPDGSADAVKRFGWDIAKNVKM
ncbi:MAG: type VI secretion system tube protein Hcp [Desulfobacterales bacterium]|nr:MAG: type VI secretion system tube protein Hcp [Desulfobacterales bacterium]